MSKEYLDIAYIAILHITMLIVIFDACLWSVVLLRHALWIKRHRQDANSHCARISWPMLATAAVMTGLFVLCLGGAWVWFKVNYGYNIFVYSILLGMHLAIIHLFALIAHCTLLDVVYWPSFSKIVSLHVVLPIRLSHQRRQLKKTKQAP